jgi:AcrR family transcriptional regulator
MRGALVAAALAVLQRDGAAKLTVRKVTEEAGCSTTGVYTWFGGKNGLVEAIFVDGFESFDRALDPHLEVDDLVGAGRAYRRFALSHQMQYLVMFGRAVPDFEPSEAALGRSVVSFAKLAEAVARFFRAAGIEDDSAAAAYHLFATVHGYVMLELAGMGPDVEADADALYERALAELGRTA